MKLNDNEPLDEAEFWDVSDTWKQEWERGVQVPVNSHNVPNSEVRILRSKSKAHSFKLPKKLIRTVEDDFFSSEVHVALDMAAEAENVCKYDMDDLDYEWLGLFNERREEWGLPALDEKMMERVLESLESQCSKRFQDALKTEKGLGIEYDEDVICDVCRSPECEEGNEMVFCDACNICVHQACYGIMAIPEGSWVCRPCALNLQPHCVLCPNPAGAMKSTSNGDQWAHVSCALWIPEVSIGCPEKMEPILRVSHIPGSRWALICALCRDRVGACIQCSVKQCKVAYHVTCAFENGLEMEMKSTALDSLEEGVKMQSFCPKHSRTPSHKKPTKRKKKEVKTRDEDEVDEHNARLHKIRSLEAEFYKYVNLRHTSSSLSLHIRDVDFVYYYWLLKRRSKFNKPLLIAKCDEANLLIKQQENFLYSRLKMFVHLRQDLERVRNLCYMISRREKLFREYMKSKFNIIEKQSEILSDASLSTKEKEEVLKARLDHSIYDKFYTVKCEVEEETSKDAPKLENPYAKCYANGVYTRSRRHTTSRSADDDEELPKLLKCKSEENINAQLRPRNGESSFTHSPLVIKVKKENEDTADALPKIDIEPKLTEEGPPKESPEITSLKLLESDLCDKENINARLAVKSRKTRSQTEPRHKDFRNAIQDLASQKTDFLTEESAFCISEELDAQSFTKHGRRNMRYQMRTRHFCPGILDTEESLPVSETDSAEANYQVDSVSSASDSIEEFQYLAENGTPTEKTPRRRRGRPRKVLPETNVVDSDKNNSCDEASLSDPLRFRMSLRHGIRDSPKSRRSAKMEEINNNLKASSPEWDPEELPPPLLTSIEQPASPRLVIRLRKDPNQETWKNDSSSSSDIPAAFRIVHNDWDGSPSDVENAAESRHRYSMRERSGSQRTLKCTLGRS